MTEQAKQTTLATGSLSEKFNVIAHKYGRALGSLALSLAMLAGGLFLAKKGIVDHPRPIATVLVQQTAADCDRIDYDRNGNPKCYVSVPADETEQNALDCRVGSLALLFCGVVSLIPLRSLFREGRTPSPPTQPRKYTSGAESFKGVFWL